ncbi:MAG: DUF3617 domain-containing protein [Allosphingosinicella sp.]
MLYRSICAAGLLALAGCGGGEDRADGNAAAGGGEETARGEGTAEIRPGQWEMTVEMPTAGIPKEMLDQMGGGKITSRQCITPEEAKASSGEMFKTDQAGDCKASDVSVGGGRMRGTMTCSGEDGGPKSVVMEGSYGPERYEMTQTMTLADGQTSEIKISGRRLGECPAGEAGTEG